MARKLPVGQLVVRKLADRSDTERVVRFHPITGERMLVNPETATDVDDVTDAPNWVHEPWPFAGLAIVGDPPKRVHLATEWVAHGVAEGWLETTGMSVEHRPGGPAEDLWRLTHSFVHYDEIVLKTVDGDVRYRVVKQPDKYVDSDNPKQKVTPEKYAAGETRVDWFYDCELEA